MPSKGRLSKRLEVGIPGEVEAKHPAGHLSPRAHPQNFSKTIAGLCGNRALQTKNKSWRMSSITTPHLPGIVDSNTRKHQQRVYLAMVPASPRWGQSATSTRVTRLPTQQIILARTSYKRKSSKRERERAPMVLRCWGECGWTSQPRESRPVPRA